MYFSACLKLYVFISKSIIVRFLVCLCICPFFVRKINKFDFFEYSFLLFSVFCDRPFLVCHERLTFVHTEIILKCVKKKSIVIVLNYVLFILCLQCLKSQSWAFVARYSRFRCSPRKAWFSGTCEDEEDVTPLQFSIIVLLE